MTLSVTRIVGVDIGGANLKYAVVAGADASARSRHFPMWRYPEKLAETLVEDLQSGDLRSGDLQSGDLQSRGKIDSLAVTMTGELADCFVDRAEGVKHIVDHVVKAAEALKISDTFFYGVDGSFQRAATARQQTDVIAASNWHALASYVGAKIAPDALLIDIGSTTTDIIPIKAGKVATSALTDYDRLSEGSLVYVGCRRTPVCALVESLQFRGLTTRVMNEHFATIDDARIVLGHVDELPDDTDSADGKPRTREFAANRLARMIGLDRRCVSIDDAAALATQIHDAAKLRINGTLGYVPNDGAIVQSGHGDDLVDLPSANHKTRLADRLNAQISRCAPAYAVAWLLQQPPAQ